MEKKECFDAALRADVLFGFLIIYLVFYVKKSSFVVPDAVSITVGKDHLYNVESFICSSLWVTKRDRNYKYSGKSVTYLLLLLCGDVETCPGPTQTYTGLQDFLTTKGFSVLHQKFYLTTKSTFSHSAKHFCLMKILLTVR